MPCDFKFYNDFGETSYSASGVFYVSLDTFRSIFQFKTTEICQGSLPNSAFSNESADITYYVNAPSMPPINPAHAMMDAADSQGIVITSYNRQSRLLKHDYVYYLAKHLLGSPFGVAFWTNIKAIKDNLEELGWKMKESIEGKFNTAYNNGGGLSNKIKESNLTRTIIEQIFDNVPARLNIGSGQNDRIDGVRGTVQPVPFIEGDTISYFWTIEKEGCPPRIYRIILYLTADSSNANTLPVDSVSSDIPPHDYINHNGIPPPPPALPCTPSSCCCGSIPCCCELSEAKTEQIEQLEKEGEELQDDVEDLQDDVEDLQAELARLTAIWANVLSQLLQQHPPQQ